MAIFVAVVILVLVAYQVYTGVTMKKVGLFGMYIEFGDRTSEPKKPEASREFIVGRWQVEQEFGQASGETSIDYQQDGTFTGTLKAFQGESGQKRPAAGWWEVDKLSAETFRLRIRFTNNETWQGTFRIFDQNHIQNIDENYIAVRMI